MQSVWLKNRHNEKDDFLFNVKSRHAQHVSIVDLTTPTASSRLQENSFANNQLTNPCYVIV